MILYLVCTVGRGSGLLRFLVRYLMRLIIGNAILGYYDRPMAWIGGYKIPSDSVRGLRHTRFVSRFEANGRNAGVF
jgi:hypothetical protein